jgi:hypothetical protein
MLAPLPDEILLHILAYLEVDDLLQISRTCHNLRSLACDPILHVERIHHAQYSVEKALIKRPSRASLAPPNAWIFLSKTNVISKQISKSLTKIRLGHNLERRPDVESLIARAILPAACTSYSSPVSPALIQSHRIVQRQRLKDGLGRKLERRPDLSSLVSMNILPEECAQRRMGPNIWAKRRQVIREDLKDTIRAWVQGRGIREQKRKADEIEFSERKTVKSLAQRFMAKKLAVDLETCTDRVSLEKRRAQARWGREVELDRCKEEWRLKANAGCPHPTRAHVLGLKRFWENVSRDAAAV